MINDLYFSVATSRVYKPDNKLNRRLFINQKSCLLVFNSGTQRKLHLPFYGKVNKICPGKICHK